MLGFASLYCSQGNNVEYRFRDIFKSLNDHVEKVRGCYPNDDQSED